MRLHKEDISDFEPWSGATTTWDNLQEHDKIDDLESTLDDIYPDGMSETELNDLLWFEPEQIYEWVGLYYDPDSGTISDCPFIECCECDKVLPSEDDRCHHDGDIYCAKCFDEIIEEDENDE